MIDIASANELPTLLEWKTSENAYGNYFTCSNDCYAIMFLGCSSLYFRSDASKEAWPMVSLIQPIRGPDLYHVVDIYPGNW